MVIPVGAGLIGYFLPSLYLDSAITSRHERLRLSLPDALDLMVVSVEAGLGLDQAMQYVGRELATTHPELCLELQMVNLEIRAGARRVEALRHLADRTGEPELRKLVAVMIQTDRFGTSIADSLRTHSDFMRVRRRQEAEERAGKVGVKLVFPIFFLILPSMLVVAAGPGLLQVFKYLFPMMRNYQGGLKVRWTIICWRRFYGWEPELFWCCTSCAGAAASDLGEVFSVRGRARKPAVLYFQ
jgi:tight adherence protein C